MPACVTLPGPLLLLAQQRSQPSPDEAIDHAKGFEMSMLEPLHYQLMCVTIHRSLHARG
jgi:hypothetical protein